MDVGRSFAFVTDDKDWAVKILIGAGILLLGILFSWLLLVPLIVAAALLSGYALEITRRVIHGNAQLLPEWSNLGTLIADGIKVVAIGIVYALPMIAVAVCVGIPAGLLSESDSSFISSVGGLFSGLLSLASLAWGVFLAFVLPAAIGFFADTGDLASAFRFGEVLALVRRNLSTYLVTVLMSWVALIVGGLGKLACGVGWLATFPYAQMVIGHLYGQAYLVARGQAAAAGTEPAQ
jgi:hypothetical protein